MNNSQPIVFFVKESVISFLHHQEVKVSGVPVKFWHENEYIRFSEFAGMERFHHYCKGPVATQYCTFQQKKDREKQWMALHNEDQHNSFATLIKALDYEIAKHYNAWVPPRKGKEAEEEVNVQIYYPLVILQGQLYAAVLRNNRLGLRKAKHVQFRKEIFVPRVSDVETYQIDVITEDYLREYLKLVESEIEKVKKAFQRKRAQVLESIRKIVEGRKPTKTKKPYREYLEF